MVGVNKITIGRSISAIGDGLRLSIYPLIAFIVTGDEKIIPIMIIMQTLGELFVNFFGGIVIDRFNKKKLCVFSEIVVGLIAMTPFFITKNTAYLFYPISFLWAIFGGLGGYADNLLVDEIKIESSIRTQLAMIDKYKHFVMAISVLVGGMLFKLFDPKYIFLIDSATFFFCALAYATVDYRPTNDAHASLGTEIGDIVKNEILAGFKSILENNKLVKITLFGLIVNVAHGLSFATHIVFMKNGIHVNDSQVSYFVFVNSLTAFVGSFMLSHKFVKHISNLKLLLISTLLYSIGLFFIGKTSTLIPFLIVFTFFSVALFFLGSTIRAVVIENADPKLKGRILTSRNFIGSLAYIGGQLITSLIITNHLRLSYSLASAIAFVGFLSVLLVVKKVKI